MRMTQQYPLFLILLFMSVLLIFSSSVHVLAEDSPFRIEFLKNHKESRLKQQVSLVKKNKDTIAEEVKSLISEAMAEGVTLKERRYLLDIALNMASMHEFLNGEGRPLLEVETVLKTEREKEKKGSAKEKKYIKFAGNFVMKEHEEQMKSEGLAPVIYPHWVHRIWFECKVCHEELFTMKMGTNNISQEHIVDGKQCGVCHNGKMAFGAADGQSCNKCHSVGRTEADHLYDMVNVDHENIKKVAKRLGAEWKPENLPGEKIPLDRFNDIDWLELQVKEVFSPIVSLDGNYKEEIKDNEILFISASNSLDNVLFSHKVHSAWIECSTCHPVIFKDELNANDIKMIEMSEGKNCGLCHGKVSFSFADCLRCHNKPKGETIKDVLIHKPKILEEVEKR